MKLFCCSVLVSAAVPAAFGCDLCAIYNVAAAHGQANKGFSLSVAEQFTHFATLQEEGAQVPDPTGQRLNSSITQVIAGYNFNERFSVQLGLPIIHRSFRRPEGFAIDRGSESGLGDINLAGNFVAWRHEEMNSTFSWSVLGGVKFPTGDSRRLAEELNEVEVPGAPESGVHGHDLALGSGSVDGIIGTGIFARSHRLFFSANVQYSIRTEGDYDYRFANDLMWASGPGVFLALSESRTVALQCVISGETKGKDTFQGAPAADTGITSVFVGPQINVTVGENFSADVGVDLPVSIRNTALQIVPDFRVRAGLTWRF